MKRFRLGISFASDAAINLHGTLGLRWLILEAVSPSKVPASSSCHPRGPDASGALLKWREEPYWSGVIVPRAPRRSQSGPLGVLL